jgi:hypothetical protein
MNTRPVQYPILRRAIAALLLCTTLTTYAAPLADPIGAGRAEGTQDSLAEARRLGRMNGRDEGKDQGYKAGYKECAEVMRQETIRRAERQGDRDGSIRGNDDGIMRGDADGQSRGEIDGNIAGDQRADAQANRDATPKGTAQGIAEANATDAAARGAADGKVAGNNEAQSDAEKNEYQPARDQLRAERFAEPIRSESTINLGAPVVAKAAPTARNDVMSLMASAKMLVGATGPTERRGNGNGPGKDTGNSAPGAGPGDPTVPNVQPVLAAEKAIAYCKANTSGTTARERPAPNASPVPGPAPQSEFEKCVDEYTPAYKQAFSAAFAAEYVTTYRGAFNQEWALSHPEGCRAAKAADYRDVYDRAYTRSFNESYRNVYDRVYRDHYNARYSVAFNAASEYSYNANYARHYAAHFEAARSAAFAARQDQLYSGAFAIARNAEYQARYPAYKKAVVARARADEAAEFVRLPVRLTSIALRETTKDGLMEPGEKITVDMDLRNFADTAILARDLDIRAVARDGSGVALPGAIVVLPRDLALKSLTHIVGALDIRLDESALGKTVSIEVQIAIRGQRLATETLSLQAKTLALVELVESPVVRLGYPGVLRMKVTNQSRLILPENAVLAISTNMQGVAFSKTSDAVNGLQSGEARELQFPFTADGYIESQSVTFVAALSLTSGRRVGILNESREIPSLQEYAFRMSHDELKDLRKSGKERIKVYVKNVSSRQATQSLTLTASITGPNAANFSFPKGNQLVFAPIAPGKEQEQDKLLVKADRANSGGTFVLEVREGGKLIGVQKKNF